MTTQRTNGILLTAVLILGTLLPGCSGLAHRPRFACERPEYRSVPTAQMARFKSRSKPAPTGSAMANVPRELASTLD